MEDVGACAVAIALFTMAYPITSVGGLAYFGECKAPSLYIFYPILKQFKRYMWYPVRYTIYLKIFLCNLISCSVF